VTGVAVALAVLAGLAGSVQVAVMGRFGGAVGVVEALTFATAVQLVFSVAILLAARGGLGGLHHVGDTPAWMWLGSTSVTVAMRSTSSGTTGSGRPRR